MCDLLVASFSSEYTAPKTLHEFMIRCVRRGDLDGWGVGFFLKNREGVIVKNTDFVFRENTIITAFDLVARCIESEIILAHFRLASRKELYGEKYAHPFKAKFLGAEWIFAHNGYSESILEYRTSNRIIHKDRTFDSPRIFEFIRDKMIEYLHGGPLRSLFYAVKNAIKELYHSYDGTYNFILANSNVVFINLDGQHPHNNRMYMIVRRKTGYDRAIIVTTVPNLTNEEWITVRPRRNHRGKLLMISEGELLYNADV